MPSALVRSHAGHENASSPRGTRRFSRNGWSRATVPCCAKSGPGESTARIECLKPVQRFAKSGVRRFAIERHSFRVVFRGLVESPLVLAHLPQKKERVRIMKPI